MAARRRRLAVLAVEWGEDIRDTAAREALEEGGETP